MTSNLTLYTKTLRGIADSLDEHMRDTLAKDIKAIATHVDIQANNRAKADSTLYKTSEFVHGWFGMSNQCLAEKPLLKVMRAASHIKGVDMAKLRSDDTYAKDVTAKMMETLILEKKDAGKLEKESKPTLTGVINVVNFIKASHTVSIREENDSDDDDFVIIDKLGSEANEDTGSSAAESQNSSKEANEMTEKRKQDYILKKNNGEKVENTAKRNLAGVMAELKK